MLGTSWAIAPNAQRESKAQVEKREKTMVFALRKGLGGFVMMGRRCGQKMQNCVQGVEIVDG